MAKTKKSEFLKLIKAAVAACCLYLWGGQGESVLLTPPEKIVKMETSATNAGRVLALLSEKVKKGLITAASQYFDCSGLMTYHLLKLGLIKADMTADGLMKKCSNVRAISGVKDYDFVFAVNAAGKAEHVGFYYKGDVYEARGRDYGVGVWKLANRTNFNKCGTFKWTA